MAIANFDLSATTETEIYECGADNEAHVEVVVTPRSSSAVITMWHTDGGATDDASVIVASRVLGVGEIAVVKRLCVDGEKLFIESDVADVSVSVTPFEKEAA